MKNPLIFFICLGMAAVARAHTPYLSPNTFEPINGDTITLDAAFAEHFFVPEVAFDNSEFRVTHPDGSVHEPDTLAPLKTRAVLEHTLVDEGTYRFSTGRRFGRVFKLYILDGERHAAENPAQPLPPGAELNAFFQSVTMAETYVSKGAPNTGALAPLGEGIELQVLSHPNMVFAGEPLRLKVLFENEPLGDQAVDVFLAAGLQGEGKPVQTLSSTAAGEIAFVPPEGGVFLLQTRYRAAAPATAPAPEYSHTYTLVVEAIE